MPSREPSSTSTSSTSSPASAASVRAWKAATVSASSCSGATTLSSPSSRTLLSLGRGRRLDGMVDTASLERELHAVGTRLAGDLPRPSRHPLKAADAKAMELAAQDAELKAALFRFVDVVPACRSLDDLARHLSGFLGEVEEPPPPVAVALKMSGTRAGRTALGAAAAAGVRHMAHRFIVGEDPKAALGVLRDLWRDGVASSVDLLGEMTVTQAEAERYAARCAEALDVIAAATREWPARPQLERDGAGPLPRANLSVKVSALTPLLRADAPERGKRDAADRLRGLLRRARDLGAHLHIDMESLDSRDAVLELVLELLAEDELRAGPSAGMVLQAYLRDSPQTLDTVLDWTRGAGAAREQPLTVRLVKGAYWDHEIVEAPSTAGTRRCSRSRPTPTGTSRSSRGGCSTAGTAARACASRSPRTTSARSPTRSPTTASPAGTTSTWSCRSCAAWATRCRRPSPPRACACGPTARSATSWPAWPTSSAGCWRTRRTTPSSPTRRRACRWRSCWRRRRPELGPPPPR